MRRGGRGEECDTTTHLIKIQVFTRDSRAAKFNIFIESRGAWSFDLYGQMTRPWSLSVDLRSGWSLPKVQKNRLEAFCGTLRSSAMQSNIIFGRSTLTAEPALLELLTDDLKAPQKASDLYSPSPSQHSIIVYCVNKLHKFSLYNV